MNTNISHQIQRSRDHDFATSKSLSSIAIVFVDINFTALYSDCLTATDSVVFRRSICVMVKAGINEMCESDVLGCVWPECCCWSRRVIRRGSVSRSCCSETTAERNTAAVSKPACKPHHASTGDSSASAYIRADGGVLARVTLHAGARRTFGQSCGVLLLLPLTHDGLTSQPLAHGLLVTRSNLLVHLRRRAGLRSSCVRLVSGSNSDLCSPLCALWGSCWSDSVPEGRARPPYAETAPRRRNTPDEAAPPPRTPAQQRH